MRVYIEKLIYGGQGLARNNGKVVFVWGGLPGEDVEINIIKEKKEYVEGIVTHIYAFSPERVEHSEEHFLSCSPWQILNFRSENFWKVVIAKETFKKIAGVDFDDFDIVSEEKGELGYRNKMRYHFIKCEKGYSLALHLRGGSEKIPISSCDLALPEINKTAEYVLSWINNSSIQIFDSDQLIIRSDGHGNTYGGLIIASKRDNIIHLKLSGSLKGFGIFLWDMKNGDISNNKKLAYIGEKSIQTKLFETELLYGLFSFFQVNPRMFEKALKNISEFIIPSKRVVDLYGGVGAISISLKGYIENCLIIENNKEAAEYAEKNIETHNLKNFEIKHGDVREVVGLIKKDDIIILDPPRTGVDARLIETFCEVLPERIVYLSCDIATQARDMKKLLPFYNIVFKRLYNFFPKTPHIESLIILDRLK